MIPATIQPVFHIFWEEQKNLPCHISSQSVFVRVVIGRTVALYDPSRGLRYIRNPQLTVWFQKMRAFFGRFEKYNHIFRFVSKWPLNRRWCHSFLQLLLGVQGLLINVTAVFLSVSESCLGFSFYWVFKVCLPWSFFSKKVHFSQNIFLDKSKIGVFEQISARCVQFLSFRQPFFYFVFSFFSIFFSATFLSR